MELLDKVAKQSLARDLRGTDQVFVGHNRIGQQVLRTAAKKFWKSKVVWLNGLAIIFSGLVEISPLISDFFGGVEGKTLVFFLAVINIILRPFTVSPLTGKGRYDTNDPSVYEPYEPQDSSRGAGHGIDHRSIYRVQAHSGPLSSSAGEAEPGAGKGSEAGDQGSTGAGSEVAEGKGTK